MLDAITLAGLWSPNHDAGWTYTTTPAPPGNGKRGRLYQLAGSESWGGGNARAGHPIAC
jgi:hypothetical protein